MLFLSTIFTSDSSYIKYFSEREKICFKNVIFYFWNWVLILISDYLTQVSLQPSKSVSSAFPDIQWNSWWQQDISFDQESSIILKAVLKQMVTQ